MKPSQARRAPDQPHDDAEVRGEEDGVHGWKDEVTQGLHYTRGSRRRGSATTQTELSLTLTAKQTMCTQEVYPS